MLVEAQSLAKRFGGAPALDGVSFQASAGEIVGLLGANGAGKSTTMRLLAGYLRPDAGAASIAGRDVVSDGLAARAALGYLPESPTGFPDLTIHEFLTFAAEARGLFGAARRRAIDRAVAFADLAPALDRLLGALSQGWRQRAWIGQAVLHDPPVLILDEPTTALDPAQKARLRDKLRGAAPDKAILISTHILEEAETLCDRVIVFRAGRIVADSPLAPLLDGAGRLAPAYAALNPKHAG